MADWPNELHGQRCRDMIGKKKCYETNECKGNGKKDEYGNLSYSRMIGSREKWKQN